VEPRSLYEAFRAVATDWPDKVAFRVRTAGGWIPITWSEQRAVVGRIARSLIALGLRRGERVAILGRTRSEWIQADCAIVGSGAVTVGVYPSNPAADCAFILRHSGSRLVLVEDQGQLDKILAHRRELPELAHVVRIEGPGDARAGVLGWDEFLARGDRVPEAEAHAAGACLAGDDLASLVYTSGTTGQPKAAMITHGNLLFSARAACECLVSRPDYETVLFLPLAHVFARLVVYMCQRQALAIALTEDLGRLPADLREIRPHFLLAVPRVYEKFRTRALSMAEARGPAGRRAFHWALRVGAEHAAARRLRRRTSAGLRLRHALADALVLRRVRAALGGRLAWAVSGSAPLGLEVHEFFGACGIPILEGLGMTENTSLSNVNRPDWIKPGTVGPPVPGVEMKLAPDGEVLLRSPNVMRGYYDDPRATAEAIDAEGWLHSGDIGRIDEDGFLTVTDRKKELIKTSGGKYVAPQRVERLLSASRYINQVVVYGDRQKYVTALITLDEPSVRAWAERCGLGAMTPAELARAAEVRRLIEGEVDAANRELAPFESVKRFCILPGELTVEAGDLTATLKLRRKAIYEKHRETLEGLYRDP
jgi:long-chain acyl-CoA synthetase